ncbi:hypothetical protein HPB50_023495 [Hyalomma asiaticum]|uniref:Uncharacterized protein n=1 Tax=Hyalomma asiaticum TaxID=266040 RepID=A0ACB7SBI1_HYAAI|nr:hypothetical protein HPB50_023495 [Hyalomma asiaticum]
MLEAVAHLRCRLEDLSVSTTVKIAPRQRSVAACTNAIRVPKLRTASPDAAHKTIPRGRVSIDIVLGAIQWCCPCEFKSKHDG